MKRDFLIIGTVMLAVYAAVTFWVSPEKPPRTHTQNQLDADPNLKLLSEENPFMRTER